LGKILMLFLAEDGIAAQVKALAIKKLSPSLAKPSPQNPT
jgi:hypothetical protein